MTREQLKIGNALLKKIEEHSLSVASYKASLLIQPEKDVSTGLRSNSLQQEQLLLDNAEKAFAAL